MAQSRITRFADGRALGLMAGVLFLLSAGARAGDDARTALLSGNSPAQDYYTRRASETLKRDEKLTAVAPHPLAAAYPRHTIVVCEAGCAGEEGARIVFMERNSAAPQSGLRPTMAPESSSGEQVSARGPSMIDCEGGCYDTPKRYAAPRAFEPTPGRQDVPSEAPRPPVKREPFDPRY